MIKNFEGLNSSENSTPSEMKLSYSLNVKYNDLNPPTSNSANIGFEVSTNFDQSLLGSNSSLGQPFSYKLSLANSL